MFGRCYLYRKNEGRAKKGRHSPMNSKNHNAIKKAQKLANLFSASDQVEAISLGGSQLSGFFDSYSDIDLYVFTRNDIPVQFRKSLAEQAGGASKSNFDLTFWGRGDEWVDAKTGVGIDIIYFDTTWMENQIVKVIDQHNASMGYTTCFWNTIRQSKVLFDRTSWFASIQSKCQSPYPDELRKNIIELNHPVLNRVIPSYFNQIKHAVNRNDIVSVNHRIAGFMASYFDVLFAFNRVLHPGEKRLISFALHNCPKLPANFESSIKLVLSSAASLDNQLLLNISTLIDNLDTLLATDPTLILLKE